MLRALVAFTAIGTLTLALLPFQLIAVRLRLGARRVIPAAFHRAVCALIGVRIRDVERCVAEGPLLIVANHVSWLDISVIAALAPVVFVAKQDVARWPVFGLLARLQRAVFVDRERRHKMRDVNAEIAGRLAAGDPVVTLGEPLTFEPGSRSQGDRAGSRRRCGG